MNCSIVNSRAFLLCEKTLRSSIQFEYLNVNVVPFSYTERCTIYTFHFILRAGYTKSIPLTLLK